MSKDLGRLWSVASASVGAAQPSTSGLTGISVARLSELARYLNSNESFDFVV